MVQKLNNAVKKTAKNLLSIWNGTKAKAKGMKHRSKFQSSRLLVVGLVFLCISRSLILCLCLFFSFWLARFACFIHSSISFGPTQANVRIYVLPFPIFVFFSLALFCSLRNILTVNSICVSVCANTHTHLREFASVFNSVNHSLCLYM